MNLLQLLRPKYYFLFQPGLGYYTYNYRPDEVKCGRTIMYLHANIDEKSLSKSEKDFQLALEWYNEVATRELYQLIEVSQTEEGGYTIREVNTHGA